MSLGGSTLFARPFFLSIGAVVIAARFLSCSSSVIVPELSSSSSFSDKFQIVLVSAAISSGKGFIVMVGLAIQSATLLAERNSWRRSLAVSS